MLPVQNLTINPNDTSKYTITFMDPESANTNFLYTFNQFTQANTTTGLGQFGSNNIAAPQYACAHQNNAFSSDFPDWLSTLNGQIDLRGFYVSCKATANQAWAY